MKKKYDEYQLEVINISHGKHIVLAPPGCGKTDILAERIAKAVENGVDYSDMICLTFTNRAAKGMFERISNRCGENLEGKLFVGNIHKFCSNYIYNVHLVSKDTNLLNEEDVINILRDIHGLGKVDDGDADFSIKDKTLLRSEEHTS
jgi:DNA helicase-2/ATP-dependent DNA helicase PcrA